MEAYISVNGCRNNSDNENLDNSSPRGFYGYKKLEVAIVNSYPVYKDTQYCKIELSGNLIIDGDIVYGTSIKCLSVLSAEEASVLCNKIIKVKEAWGKSKFNYIKNGELLSTVWFDNCDMEFHCGYATVRLNGRYNWISESGNILFTKWFDKCYAFHDGLALVEIGGKYNYLKPDKSLLLDKSVDDAYEFENGFAHIVSNYKHYFINTSGTQVTSENFDHVACHYTKGLTLVKLNGKFNFLNDNFQYLFEEWFNNVNIINKNVIVVKKRGKYNYIVNKKLLCNDWFDEAHRFTCGLAKVKINGKFNYVKETDGKYLSETWFDKASGFNEGFAIVKLGKFYNFISTNGTYINNDVWFDKASCFEYGKARVRYRNYIYNIDYNGDEVRWDNKAKKFVKTGRSIEEIEQKECNNGTYTYNLIGHEINDNIVFPMNSPWYMPQASNNIIMNKTTGEMFVSKDPYTYTEASFNNTDTKEVKIYMSVKIRRD